MPRTAVLSTAFRPRRPIRVFDPSGDAAEIQAFAPQAIAGSLAHLDSLAGLPSVTHAIIVLRTESDPALTGDDRDRLWRAFHVPIFEQIVAADGTLLAAECEAHDGLHIESPRFASPVDETDSSPCPCGRPGPRLVPSGSRARTVAAGQPI